MVIRAVTAGWSLPAGDAAAFPGEGSQLQRYARVCPGVEVNSSFHRAHRPSTWTRWALEAPASFRFAVKLPRAITHDARLVGAGPRLEAFLAEIDGLGKRLGPLLVQLPPSLAFDADVAEGFFGALRQRHGGAVVCEPRHPSWFAADAEAMLAAHAIARVGADPAPVAAAAQPGGWSGPAPDGTPGVVYFRWHGSPRRYWSAYGPAWLQARADELARLDPALDVWCVFDNTAGGAATANALELQRLAGR